MFGGCLAVRKLINQSVKLSAISQPTRIRNYTITYDEDERRKKVKARVIKVNVISPDQKVTCMTMEQAQKMAKRRDLTLLKLEDPPKFASFSGRDVYEMITKSHQVKLSAEPAVVDSESEFKEKKTVTFSSSIAMHDVNIKLKQIKKWLSKNHIVVVIVAADGTGEGMQEKSTQIKEELTGVCKITSVTKKKQTVLTLEPPITKTESNQDTTPSGDLT